MGTHLPRALVRKAGAVAHTVVDAIAVALVLLKHYVNGGKGWAKRMLNPGLWVWDDPSPAILTALIGGAILKYELSDTMRLALFDLNVIGDV